MTTSRQVLPPRRMQLTYDREWNGQRIEHSVGFNRDGTACETFIEHVKAHSEIAAVLTDACVMASLHLQRGMTAAELACHLGRESVDPLAPFASAIGAVTAWTAEAERLDGPSMARAYTLLLGDDLPPEPLPAAAVTPGGGDLVSAAE